MNPNDADPRLIDWLDSSHGFRAPDRLLDDIVARTARTGQRPAWRNPERWLPVTTTMRLAYVPRAVLYLALLALLLALAGVVLAVGSQGLPSPAVVPVNGLIAWDSTGDIWIADPDGSGAHAITSGTDVDIDPTFSPDGRMLAFWRLLEPQPSKGVSESRINTLIGSADAMLIMTLPDGSEPRTIAEKRLSQYALTPSWSPDGQQLVFAAKDGIYTVAVGGGDPVRLQPGEGPSWSPDGHLIAYRGSPGIWVMNADGSDAHHVGSVQGDSQAFLLPDWSPSGRQIAFYANQPDSAGGHDIWIMDADGGHERMVSGLSEDEIWPFWSPDGSRLAFIGDDRNGVMGGLVVVDLATGDRTILGVGHVGAGAPLVWSPDGRYLLGFHPQDSDGYHLGVLILGTTRDTPTVLATMDPLSTWASGSWQRLAG
jgi:Tol biopolymer transport system component